MNLEDYSFTFSQKAILKNIQKDFLMWNEKSFDDIFPNQYLEKYKNKQLSKKYLNIMLISMKN
jgi:hypothetical protein